MARQIIQRGNFKGDHAHAEDFYDGAGKINDMTLDIYSRLSHTISAGEARFSAGATTEARVDLALSQALLELAFFVEIPAFMSPFDISQVNQTNLATFHATGGRFTREGGDPTVYDALAYGSTFNGTRDNWQNLKALADALRAFGGTAYLPAGTCISSGDVYWPQGTILRGAGRGVTIIKRASGSVTNGDANNTGGLFRAGTADGVDYTQGSHGSKISVYDMTLDGNTAGNPGITNPNLSCHAVRFHFVDDLHFSQVEVLQWLESGIYLWGCRRTSNVAVSCHHNGLITVASSRNGYAITGPQDDAVDRGAQDDHEFLGCEAYNNTDEGISVGRNGRIVVKGCFLHDNGDMGLEGDTSTATSDATNVPAGWIIEGNHIYSNGTAGGIYPGHGIGIGNTNVQRVIISGNLIEDNPGAGIAAAFTSGSLIQISDNIIRNWGTASVGYHGISVGGFDRAIIADNELDGGSGTISTGIVCISQATARHLSIKDNVVVGAQGGGLSITGTATGQIKDNVFYGVSPSANTLGMVISSGANGINHLDIDDNTVMNYKDAGIWIRTNGAGNVQNVRLRHNTCTDDQGVKTQAYGLKFSETGGGLITLTLLDNNDLEGNLTGRETGIVTAMVRSISVPDRTQVQGFVTPALFDPWAGQHIEFGALTGNVQFNSPTNAVKGMLLTYHILQDGTGGRTVTFAGTHVAGWSDAGNTAGKRSSITFRYNGTNWVPVAGQGLYA